jgi:hypothetical protein
VEGLEVVVGRRGAALSGRADVPARPHEPGRGRAPDDARQHAHDTEVEAVLRRSCNDCHSSETVWPWYSNVSPVSWFLKSHIDEGRRQLSFSEWATYPKRKRERKLHEMCEQVESGEMPLKSYLPLHPSARLSDDDKRVICEWTSQEEERQPEDPQTQSDD